MLSSEGFAEGMCNLRLPVYRTERLDEAMPEIQLLCCARLCKLLFLES